MDSVTPETPHATSTSFRPWLNGRPASPALLKEYVDGLPAEWWTSELKACEDHAGFGVRKTVAAMANSRGGEVFIGVRDDRSLVGTPTTLLGVEQELAQPNAQPGPWYIVNLQQPVDEVVPVEGAPLGLGDRCLVLHVRRMGVPVFAREYDGRLSLYLRSGSSSVRAAPFEALEHVRQNSRERLLLGIFRELETMVAQIRIAPNYDLRTTAGVFPSLPFFTKSLEDGRFYELLTDTDIVALLGRRSSGQSGDTTGGSLTRFLDLDALVARVRERHALVRQPHEVDRFTISELNNQHQMLEQDVAGFRAWLVQQRLLVAEH
jgi:hypothetical protein